MASLGLSYSFPLLASQQATGAWHYCEALMRRPVDTRSLGGRRAIQTATPDVTVPSKAYKQPESKRQLSCKGTDQTASAPADTAQRSKQCSGTKYARLRGRLAVALEHSPSFQKCSGSIQAM